jgi:DNA-binding NarL/FixJ family response regulator
VPAELAEDVLSRLTDSRAPGVATLTPRQRDVARLPEEGRTVKEIAAPLGLSTRTVETHKYQALDTFGRRRTADLIRYAVEHGLVTPPRQG